MKVSRRKQRKETVLFQLFTWVIGELYIETIAPHGSVVILSQSENYTTIPNLTVNIKPNLP